MHIAEVHRSKASPAPVHVERAPMRREPVAAPGSRERAAACIGEIRPDHRHRVEHVEVVELACRRRAAATEFGDRLVSSAYTKVMPRFANIQMATTIINPPSLVRATA